MTWIVIATSLKSNLFTEWDFLASIPWMTATLWDFYANVFVLLCWVIYKETNWLSRILWIVLFSTLGSIGTCLYVLYALVKWDEQTGIAGLISIKHSKK